MKNQKGFIGIGIIVAIMAALIVGGGAVYFVTKPVTPDYQIAQDDNYQSQTKQNTQIQSQEVTKINKDKSLSFGGTTGRGDEGGIKSPDGKRTILIETSEGEGVGGDLVYYIIIDGKNGKTYKFIGDAIFSPDSKQYAYVAGNGNEQFVVQNGIELKHYEYLNTLSFSPDNSSLAYVVSIGQQPNGRQFVVNNGIEGKKYQKIELAFSDYGRGFSLNSKHFIYSALENSKWFVVDGREGNKYDRISMLTISADGKRVTYEAQTSSKEIIKTETITENLE